MKTKTKSGETKLSEKITINPSLNPDYSDQPFIQKKVEKVKKLIETYGLPKL